MVGAITINGHLTMDNGQWISRKEQLLGRILDFGVRIIKLVDRLPNTQEAQDASSKPDFINKMSIALREAKESKFWLQLIQRSELLPDKIVNPELKEADELCAIYSTIVKKARLNLSNVKSQMSNVSGFTLIEILVVTSIIAVITVVGLTFYQDAQIAARDSTRKSDLLKLAAALEIYLQKNNSYVIDTTVTCPISNATTSIFYDTIDDYLTGAVPKDPKTGTLYCYISVNNGQGFRLFTKLEKCTDALNTFCSRIDYNYTYISKDLTIAAPP